MMKFTKLFVCFAVSVCLICGMVGCAQNNKSREQSKTQDTFDKAGSFATPSPTTPAQLPIRYQSAGYVLPKDKLDTSLTVSDTSGEFQIKVGATIRSTNGPLPLWDVMKRLANLKGMTVSWASDVDQNALVDVDISATDNFFDAITNLLRQADYFHEVNEKNIVIRNKTTKVFKMAVPFMQGGYTSSVGGNFLANKDAASGTEGSVKIASADNKFNVWENIETNLRSILQTSSVERKDVTGSSASPDGKKNAESSKNAPAKEPAAVVSDTEFTVERPAARYSAKDEPSFVIDRSVGLITVTAKPALLDTVEKYLDNLKNHLFRQINIEAKIVEVFLQDNSKIGIDWSSVFKDSPLSGTVHFGTAGQVYPDTPGGFVSRITLSSFNFTVLLNALNEQGDSHVLANPKLTVLNGQPALISVGKDVAYVKSITRDETESTGGSPRVTFTAEVGNVVQGIALGVMASIVDNNKVVLHLTPITTDIENLMPDGSIAMTTLAEGAIELGLPQVKVREMSTMVEVQNGEMLVIGGLIDSVEVKNADFIPGLGSIPVVKYLFGVEEKRLVKRELVILLSPKII
ncbi:pilus (MSHA type) biogenesis protein MshL [Desulfobulbus sp.]|uniref:pilus (MSHA type) biogenesis protein MshL n=1 Tax=Desulfobulbus sp. TaxID=895 RepID=UPI00286ED6C1|nr:pilus (MSHA type) biogenesis protein MshL [Desulfobulbus sp.]